MATTPKPGTAYAYRRRKGIREGTWPGTGDVTEACAIIDELKAQGMSLRLIADISGVPRPTVKALNSPTYRPTFVYGTTLQKLRAARFSLDALPDDRWIPSIGSARRLQALAAIGWPLRELADRLGVTFKRVYAVPRHPLITVRNARKIRAVYDELWDKPGPSPRTVSISRLKGYPPPLAWDDDTIDDPAATPHPWLDITTRGNVRKPGVFVEDVEWLVAAGEGIEGAARRLGVHRHSLVDMLRQRGRQDLTERLRLAEEQEAS